MKRRGFLITVGVISAFSSVPLLRRTLLPTPLIIQDAYTLWYNRPAIAEIPNGFCFGYVTSKGEIYVAEINDQLLAYNFSRLHSFENASDHSSPSLIRVPKGKYSGHILACFSNHASPLLFTRSTDSGSTSSWEKVRVVDGGRSTYTSLAALPDGKIILMHTLQERSGTTDATEWRKVVARITSDGGDTWSEPAIIAGIGPGTFPYSTAISVGPAGECAMAYAIYSSKEKRHHGLTLSLTSDAFSSKREIPIPLGEEENLDTIPYETKWVSDKMVAVSYSQMDSTGKQGLSRIVTINVESSLVISNIPVSQVAVHSYAGGAAIGDNGSAVIYSPIRGGLYSKNMSTGKLTELVGSGRFSSPWLFRAHGKILLVALKNPSIKTTKNYSSEILIMPVESQTQML
ncbi:sialidase family protein [Pseudomonas brassicacearum]|uniref:sialidase family protein n=1 Tax=Pseudomonas brassicacearum TaxID=930166 RepID=UPI0009BB6795|nr:sialidase family protein [Pseudomonas brassicacearum]